MITGTVKRGFITGWGGGGGNVSKGFFEMFWSKTLFSVTLHKIYHFLPSRRFSRQSDVYYVVRSFTSGWARAGLSKFNTADCAVERFNSNNLQGSNNFSRSNNFSTIDFSNFDNG